jgi:hypothetical protein
MIFGEHFAEPAMEHPIKGFEMWHGGWKASGGVAEVAWTWPTTTWGPPTSSALLLSKQPVGVSGQSSVEVSFEDKRPKYDTVPKSCGLFLRGTARSAADGGPTGLMVHLTPDRHLIELRLWDPKQSPPFRVLKFAKHELPAKTWLKLTAKWSEKEIEVLLDGQSVFHHPLSPAVPETGRSWGWFAEKGVAQFRNLRMGENGSDLPVALDADSSNQDQVSRHWRAIRKGQAEGRFSVVPEEPLAGVQCQRMELLSGSGEVGLANQGLHQWGTDWIAGRDYEGEVWARTQKPVVLQAVAESGDGSTTYAEQRFTLQSSGWQKLDVKLTPDQSDSTGRFAIKLREPGSVDVGYVFLQKGKWGRFKGLPVRRDIAEEMCSDGVSAIRFSATLSWLGLGWQKFQSWKTMTGPRERRNPFPHYFYDHSSAGWAWMELLQFCEAAGMLPIPNFSIHEKPEDLMDFIEYANGPADSPWGRRRVEDGHPEPFNIRHIQIGNELAVPQWVWEKFEQHADAIWSKYPQMVLIFGSYVLPSENEPSAKGMRKILEVAKRHHAEVWIDGHLGANHPDNLADVSKLTKFVEILNGMADGANFKVVVLELNGVEHSLLRGLSIAQTLGGIAALGDRVPVVCASNGLESDLYCDNGWSQGHIFFNGTKAWSQPSSYVLKMISSSRLPLMVPSKATGIENALYPTAETDEARRTLVLRIVNVSEKPVTAKLEISGFKPGKAEVQVSTLEGKKDAVNTAEQPDAVSPKPSVHSLKDGPVGFTFPPYSFTVLRFE